MELEQYVTAIAISEKIAEIMENKMVIDLCCGTGSLSSKCQGPKVGFDIDAGLIPIDIDHFFCWRSAGFKLWC